MIARNNVKKFNPFKAGVLVLMGLLSCRSGLAAQALQGGDRGADIQNILPERERDRVMDEWTKWRLDNILPDLMRREGIDLWLVIAQEPDPGPVYFSLLPAASLYVVRTSILIFHDEGPGKGVKRLSGGSSGIPGWYQSTWLDKKNKTQFQSLADTLQALNPKKIGINTSTLWGYGDHLTAGLKDKLTAALGPELSRRLVSADRLCVGWLETRSPRELSVYRQVCGIAHDLIHEFFSNRVIVPDITTAADVEWWFRQRVTDLGLETWFHPSIDIIRSKKDAAEYGEGGVIRRGDLLHCDVGIVYLGLHSDMQWSAYILKKGEEDAPAGLRKALDNANRVADILMAEFVEGRTGNAIVDEAMKKAAEEGLRPLIYSHPIGVYGHAAGPPIDARAPESAPEGSRLRGEYPLHFNTAYAIEFSATTKVAEWDGEDVRIGFEENAVFTKAGCKFIDGRQRKLLLIK
ncbi:MAG: M24 family metallopeptidase [Candidatus Aminicenantes bacterium]|nr:M24 family metallopeptidase [Candidatus Aminicenantes bacterium]